MSFLFLKLLNWLHEFGEITEANIYKGDEFSSISVKICENTFRFTITKEAKKDGSDRD